MMQQNLFSWRERLVQLLAFAGIAVGANLLAVLAVSNLYTYIRSAADQVFMERASVLLNRLMWVTFVVPTLVTMPFILPITLARSGAGRSLQRARRLVLNVSLLVSLLGATGWLMAIALYIIGWQQAGAAGGWAIPIKIVTEFLIFSAVSFVVSFYCCEFLQRRWLVPRLFPDNRISDVGRRTGLSLRQRFMVNFFTLTVFPVGVFVNILANIDPQRPLPVGIPLTVGLLFLVFGTVLTFMLVFYFQHPLNQLAQAVRTIRQGGFDIRLPVVTNDELGLLAESLNELGGELAEKRRITEAFGRAVDPSVRDYLLAEHGGLGGQLRTVTLLFSDIRGFTSASETMHPARVVDWLNQYFGEMAACIEAEGGMVNRYIGDAILAVFGAPNDHPRHAAAAIRAARRMREARDSLNRRLEADGFPAISAGIAVHTGAVLAGTIGSSQRMEYTVIGDPVNLTARFEKLTKTAACNILVSEDCRAAAGDDAGLRPMGRVKVRGSSRAIRLWGC